MAKLDKKFYKKHDRDFKMKMAKAYVFGYRTLMNPKGSLNDGARLMMNFGQGLCMPARYATPREELLACRNTAWLGSFLNISPVYDISGPDAVKLLNYVTVNRDYSKLKVGGSRHSILCNDEGYMLADGVLMRINEDTFRTYWLAPVLAYYVDSGDYDVKGEYIKDEYFFQIDGPKSLEIMEQACGEDLHDMKFAQHKNVKIAGTEVRIHRLGMSGALAYEFHGDMKNGDKVFAAVRKAGEPFGLQPLGFTQYCRNHTQGGYPNQWIHFFYPYLCTEPQMTEYMKKTPYENEMFKEYNFLGSAADDTNNAFVTPFDVGWEYLINYDHDFIGKEALAKIKKNPPRQCVTLEWNTEDVGKAFALQLEGKMNVADDITTVGDGGEAKFVMSKVVDGKKQIGVATGRAIDFYHNKMISLCFLNKEYAKEGKELTLLWGTDPNKQVKIRATVAPFPYYNEEYRNETFDVEKIPHPKF